MGKNSMKENGLKKKFKTTVKKKIIIISVILMIGILAGFLVNNFINRPEKLVYVDDIPLIANNNFENIVIKDSIDRTTHEWLEYKDLNSVKKDIERQVSKLIKALDSGNLNKVVKYFSVSEREYYTEIFDNNKEKMKELSSYFNNMELVYLSSKTKDGETSFHRIAEYKMTFEHSSLSVVFIYENRKLYIKYL